MSKVSRGLTSHYKHKETLKLVKGYYGRRKSCIKTAKQAVDRSCLLYTSMLTCDTNFVPLHVLLIKTV